MLSDDRFALTAAPAATAAFTGHRTYDGRADEALRRTLGELYVRGFRRFLCGMAVGFDLAAAEVLLSCGFADASLIAVVPFAEQPRRFPTAERERYRRVLAAAADTVIICPEYTAGCYALRNDFLVDHASLVVAYCDGTPGGTAYTVRRARRLGREVINLAPELQQRLF